MNFGGGGWQEGHTLGQPQLALRKQNSLYIVKLNGILEVRIEQRLPKASCGNDGWTNLAKKKERILKAGDTTE